MKKLMLIASAALVAASAYSQGTVSASSGTALLNNGLTGQPLVVGTTFKVGLYYLPDQAQAPTADDFTARGILLGPSVNISPLAGRYSTGTRSTPATTAPGGDAYFQIRAWESAFGATYNEVLANTTPQGGRLGLLGTSTIVKITTANPTTVPPGTPTGIAVPGFVLNPVPEPSVIGLGLLGVGALLLLRRRK